MPPAAGGTLSLVLLLLQPTCAKGPLSALLQPSAQAQAQAAAEQASAP